MSEIAWQAKVLRRHERLWNGGMLPALFQTVRFCYDAQIVMPEWAARGAMQVIQDQFHDLAPRNKRGAKSSLKARFRMDYAHYLRWNAVRWAMLLNFAPNPKKRGAPKKGTIPKEEILKEAKKHLRNRLARHGGDAQMWKSYRDVEKSRNAGEPTFAFDELYYDLE